VLKELPLLGEELKGFGFAMPSPESLSVRDFIALIGVTTIEVTDGNSHLRGNISFG
jgi:hypothetical protein